MLICDVVKFLDYECRKISTFPLLIAHNKRFERKCVSRRCKLTTEDAVQLLLIRVDEKTRTRMTLSTTNGDAMIQEL